MKSMNYLKFSMILFLFMFMFIYQPPPGTAQTVIIDGKEFLPDTISNGNIILVKYTSVEDTAGVADQIQNIDFQLENISQDLQRLQDERVELQKKRSKLITVKDKIKPKEKGSNGNNRAAPPMGDKDSGFSISINRSDFNNAFNPVAFG